MFFPKWSQINWIDVHFFLSLNFSNKNQAIILIALSVALAEEVAEKKTEKRWAYGTGVGYNNGYNTLGNSVYSQPSSQYGT